MQLFAEKPPEKKFYEDRERGWYWFEQQEKPTNKKPEMLEEISSPSKTPEQELKELQEKIESARITAVMQPTLENVVAYYAMQKQVLDKADEFSRVSRLAILAHPELLEPDKNPINRAATRIAYNEAKKERGQSLREFADEFGLILFVSKDCPYCTEQTRVLDVLRNKYKFSVSLVSYEETESKGEKVAANPALIKKFGVKYFPSIFAYNPKQKLVVPVSNGLITFDDLERNIDHIRKQLLIQAQASEDLENREKFGKQIVTGE